MTKEEKKALKKAKYIEQKMLQSQREKVYQEMIAYQKERQKEVKSVPVDSAISLQNVNKIYPNRVQAVFDFNFEIKEHEFIVLVGPSGCGKSTTLRMIAGLEEITAGDLFIDGKYANDLEPKDRDVAMVFQSYALYPHMSVYDNLSFGLEVRKIPKEEIDQRVKEAAEILEISEYLDRKPKALSGGQKQRVALGRAIVRNSRIFLMDEPLSNLDAKLRVQMRSEIVNLHNKLGTTTVYVTHDQTEAMTMATRIVVMKAGYIQQIGTPKEIYNHPANTFVATFIGAPAMNILDATYEGNHIVLASGRKVNLTKEMIKAHDDFYVREIDETKQKIARENEQLQVLQSKEKPNEYQIKYHENEIEVLEAKLAKFISIQKSKSHQILFGIRPEDIIQEGYELKDMILTDFGPLNIDVAELLGNEYSIHSQVGKKKLIMKVNAGQDLAEGTKINVAFNIEKIHLFDAITEHFIF